MRLSKPSKKQMHSSPSQTPRGDIERQFPRNEPFGVSFRSLADEAVVRTERVHVLQQVLIGAFVTLHLGSVEHDQVQLSFPRLHLLPGKIEKKRRLEVERGVTLKENHVGDCPAGRTDAGA